MGVQFIGMIQPNEVSETFSQRGASVDPAFVRAFAQAHEYAGFDRILVPASGTSPDTVLTVTYAALATERIHFLLAHRPGFVAPTLAARQFATLDQYIGGRLAVHYITGGSDADQARDGDFVGHDERYARSDEYLEVLRKVWTADAPFDHEGRFYRFENAWSEVKPLQKPYVPIFFGGASAPALEVAGKHADVYALWGESLAQAGTLVQQVRAAAAKHQRGTLPPRSPASHGPLPPEGALAGLGRPGAGEIGFSISFRPILGRTEGEAWDKAARILQDTQALQARQGIAQGFARGGPQQSVGAQRLLADAAKGDVVDERLWTAIARQTGGRSNTTSLVGTPEQVADALLKYHDLGIARFLIRGFDPLVDAVEYGRELIPLVREKVAAREAQAQALAKKAA